MKIYRPPLDAPYVQMLREIMQHLNTKALIPFTLHDVLEKVIEIAYRRIVRKEPLAVNKRYYEIDF